MARRLSALVIVSMLVIGLSKPAIGDMVLEEQGDRRADETSERVVAKGHPALAFALPVLACKIGGVHGDVGLGLGSLCLATLGIAGVVRLFAGLASDAPLGQIHEEDLTE